MKKISEKESIKNYFRKGFKNWKKEFKEYRYLILISILVVILSTFIDYRSGIYVSTVKTAHVPDLILDNIGPYNLNLIFIYGYLAIVFIYFLYPIIFHITKLHKAISQFAILVTIRSFFIIFTHLQTPLDAIHIVFPWIFKNLSFENDLFFSGHAAVPFLGFLVFKQSKIKYLFLITSIVMGITVLAMHLHYSIDVFAAFFITYGSFKITEFFLNSKK